MIIILVCDSLLLRRGVNVQLSVRLTDISTLYVVSDTTVEHATNDAVGTAVVKLQTSASEDILISARSRDQSSTSVPESVHDKVHSSVSEDLREPSQLQSQGSIIEDVPDTGRSRGTATSLAEELPNTSRSSRALSSVAEDAKTESRSQSHSGPQPGSGHSGIKSVSLEKSAERSAVVRSQTSNRQDYSNDDESVATEIDSEAEAKYVCLFWLVNFSCIAKLQLLAVSYFTVNNQILLVSPIGLDLVYHHYLQQSF